VISQWSDCPSLTSDFLSQQPFWTMVALAPGFYLLRLGGVTTQATPAVEEEMSRGKRIKKPVKKLNL